MRSIVGTFRSGWVVVAQLIVFGLAFAGCSRESTPPVAVPVVRDVVDGDTIVVTFPNGAHEHVRLLGVDTPETVDPSRPVQCFGAEASAFVNETIPPGTEIRLERDVEARDHFGRLLAYVYRADDDVFVNRELVRLGYADVSIYAPNDGHSDSLRAALTSAKTALVGLWSACGGADVALDPTPSNE